MLIFYLQEYRFLKKNIQKRDFIDGNRLNTVLHFIQTCINTFVLKDIYVHTYHMYISICTNRYMLLYKHKHIYKYVHVQTDLVTSQKTIMYNYLQKRSPS